MQAFSCLLFLVEPRALRTLAPLEITRKKASFFLAIFSWSRESDLNRRPAAYKAAALPAELSRRNIYYITVFLLANILCYNGVYGNSFRCDGGYYYNITSGFDS